jgi:hypothetical protein
MRNLALATFGLLLAAAPLTAQTKHKFAYQFEAGSVAWTQQVQDMNMSMNMGGREMTQTMKTTMWLESKVTELKDGIAAIEQKYTRVAATGDGMGMKTSYDSDVEGSKPGQLKDLASMVGKTSKVRVGSDGKIHEFTLADGVEGAAAQAGASLKQTFEQSYMTWPKDGLAIGETWVTEFDMPMGQIGTGKAKVTNKLIDVKDHVVTLEQKVEMDLSAAKMPGGGKLEVTKAGGTSKIDLRRTMPVEMVMDMEMKMGGEGSPMQMTMTMHQEMKQCEAPAPKKAAAPATGK